MDDEKLQSILALRKIAVVGMSRDPSKAAHYVPKYLQEHGYDIVPVNPAADEILGVACHDSVLSVSAEIVEIFRPSELVLPFVQDAIKTGPKAIWLQEGISNAQAESLARDHGIDVVSDRCMMAEHRRLCA
ncbi:MAG: CoA-binding protein [Nitrosopumilus sp. H8]|nr:MAG: CoA-binding protein [Nitrosopumilus sp. H8]